MEHPHGHQAQAQKTRASLAKIVISTDETQIMKTSKANILAANSETKHVRWNAEVTLGCKVRFSHGSTINRWLPSAQARLLKTAFSKNPPGEVTHRAADAFATLRHDVLEAMENLGAEATSSERIPINPLKRAEAII